MVTVHLCFALLCIFVEIHFTNAEFINITSHVLEHRQKRFTEEHVPELTTDRLQEVAFSGLLKESHTFDKSPMSRLSMSCKGEGYSAIIKAFPLAEIRWIHNGDTMVLQPSRMVTTLDSLTIQNLIPSDGGVYHCQLAVTESCNIVVKFYSVVVGNLTKHVHVGENLPVNCQAKELGNIFENATRVWYSPAAIKIIQKPAKDYSEDVISSANNKTAGTWTCFVENTETNQTWTTARISIVLEPPLSGWNKIKRYAKNNKPIVFAVFFFSTFVIVLIIDGITKLLEWKEKKFKKELDDVQTILGLDPTGAGPESLPLMLDEDQTMEYPYLDSESEGESNV